MEIARTLAQQQSSANTADEMNSGGKLICRKGHPTLLPTEDGQWSISDLGSKTNALLSCPAVYAAISQMPLIRLYTNNLISMFLTLPASLPLLCIYRLT
jgi:hypothetical protein